MRRWERPASNGARPAPRQSGSSSQRTRLAAVLPRVILWPRFPSCLFLSCLNSFILIFEAAHRLTLPARPGTGMSIIVQCGNGHRLSVAEQYQGMRVLCPECRDVVTVPAAATAAAPLPQPAVDLRYHVQPPAPAGSAPVGSSGPAMPPPLPAREPFRDDGEERPRRRDWGRNDDDDDFSRDRDGLPRDPQT